MTPRSNPTQPRLDRINESASPGVSDEQSTDTPFPRPLQSRAQSMFPSYPCHSTRCPSLLPALPSQADSNMNNHQPQAPLLCSHPNQPSRPVTCHTTASFTQKPTTTLAPCSLRLPRLLHPTEPRPGQATPVSQPSAEPASAYGTHPTRRHHHHHQTSHSHACSPYRPDSTTLQEQKQKGKIQTAAAAGDPTMHSQAGMTSSGAAAAGSASVSWGVQQPPHDVRHSKRR